MRKFTGPNEKGESVKRLGPTAQRGYPSTPAHWFQPGVDTADNCCPSTCPQGVAPWERGSFSSTASSSNNSHQGLRLQEMEAKETFICPSAQRGHCHQSGTNGVWRGMGGQRERPALLPGWKAAPWGSQGQDLCVSVCPPRSLARPAPLRCTPDTGGHRLLQGQLDLLLVRFTARQPWLPLALSTRTSLLPLASPATCGAGP